MTNILLSIGHGFTAREFGKFVQANGWQVIGTTRSEAKTRELADLSVEPYIWPGSDLADSISKASHILVSAAPNASGDLFLNEYRAQLNASQNLKWIGYLSTTGVYGDHGGAWVDEETPVEPTTKRGQFRAAAEIDWMASGLPVHIFRLAGIYGAGRGPFQKLRGGSARLVKKKGQVFGRIHIEDIAQSLFASTQSPDPGRIYNLSDDEPAPPEDILGYAAKLLEIPMPPEVDFETADMTPMARSFYSECKRVKNDRMKSELGIELKYPGYKEALDAILKAEQS
ncbi:MAG: SDR family oxidoreductase [Paracoccaceae bacterium]|jgi:nucleoside-diphosphate-sugar epimerase|nr:SDR family oxidoreductase [Paracoccaceae bacterium]